MLAGAASPWTCAATRTTRVSGQRRASTWQMSFQTAPLGLVITAIVAGRVGSASLAFGREQPFRREPGLERLEAEGQVAEPGRLDRVDVELERALRLEQVDPAVRDDAQPRLRLERGTLPVVAEPDALELVAFVLQREVGVAGRSRS